MFRWLKKRCTKKAIVGSSCSSTIESNPLPEVNTNSYPQSSLDNNYYGLDDQNYHIYTEIPESAICRQSSPDCAKKSAPMQDDSILSEILAKSPIDSDNISLCSLCRVMESHLCECQESDLANLTTEMENLWSEYAEHIFQSTPNSKDIKKASTDDGYEVASRFVFSKLDMSRRPLPPIPGEKGDDVTSGDDSSGFYEPMYCSNQSEVSH